LAQGCLIPASARTGLGKPMFDVMLVTDPVEDVVEGVFVMRHVGELDAPFGKAQDRIISQHGVDGIRHSSDQVAQELGGGRLPGFPVQLDEGELACPVDRHEQP
jgi:hypothetical protein